MSPFPKCLDGQKSVSPALRPVRIVGCVQFPLSPVFVFPAAGKSPHRLYVRSSRPVAFLPRQRLRTPRPHLWLYIRGAVPEAYAFFPNSKFAQNFSHKCCRRLLRREPKDRQRSWIRGNQLRCWSGLRNRPRAKCDCRRQYGRAEQGSRQPSPFFQNFST